MNKIGAVVALGLVVVLAGCAQPGTRNAGSSPDEKLTTEGAPASGESWTSCAAAGVKSPTPDGRQSVDLPHLDVDFQPVSVVVCETAVQRRADGGEDLVAVEKRGEKIDGLLAALRLPDEKPTSGVCTMDVRMVRWFALVDADGRWIHPGTPTDACGKVRMEVVTAAQGLELTEVSSQVVGEVESAEAVAAGCSQQWADMVWVETTMDPSRSFVAPGSLQPSAWPAADRQVRLCVYTVATDQQRTGKPGGEFERGGLLDAAQWTAIAKALRAAGPAGRCTEPASRFALLRSADNTSGEIYVELAGCLRVLVTPGDGNPALGQAGSNLIRLLTR